ncbi:3-isopropylmalate dehydratase small subunit [Sphingobium phenoxybenzoativorans]|uniref:3-isopropylmalate dehydratase small subunit n=1 Tax=Sphingobium phenoxybenzoativorans TaxID=1592790 RepID=A0A975KBW7_9SPHN|nr:3-isopropylmalate dehydratase small subunit [Sphingobium phenoxybenzoativorans]QUT08119.1 3-isopropylmalate dehydratase small subunit [Sphingobium phenoxybenzoativorans]
MEPFTTLTAIAAPLLRDNIDTDAIIPSREMRSVTKTGLADGLFAGWRYSGVSSREPDPDFILNDPRFAPARILLSGANFGCGSSREHAVWALAEFGFRAIIAESFNPIFRGNCVNNGIVPVELDCDAIARIAASLGHWPASQQVTVDLQRCTVSTAQSDLWQFQIDDEAQEMLLGGMDAIELTLTRRDAIDRARAADRLRRPWIYLEQGRKDSAKEQITN